jgi:subtilisin-like proprotein convertase family protein
MTKQVSKVFALTVCVALALPAGSALAKKKRGGNVFTATQAVNIAVPNNVAAAASVPVTRTITVPKKFKGRVVGDLNVTGLQATGNAADSVDDLSFILTAPDGMTVQFLENRGDQTLGPWTLDDDTRTAACDAAAPPCGDPDATLNRPFAGTSNLVFLNGGDTGPLSAFNGSQMRGTWTLNVYDDSGLTTTSTLNSWGLKITAASPLQGTGKAKAFTASLSPNAAIPDAPAAGASTPVRTSLVAGKSFKGKVVGDLDVTGITTTGDVADAADDVNFRLTAPNGRTVQLSGGHGDQSVGPWTLDDESRASICDISNPPCPDPAQSLNRPFAGTSNVIDTGVATVGPLSAFDGVPIKGTWTLTAFDDATTQSSTLNAWGLRITPAKPPKSSRGGKKALSAKKKKRAKAFAEQKAVNAAVPPDAAAGASTALTSTITVGKKFKGLTVGDLDVTGIQTTGDAASAANDLTFRLSAPNGNSAKLFQELGDQSIGPLTINSETFTSVCNATAPPCTAPNQTLNRPFAGTANTVSFENSGTGPLGSFDGAPMRGVWTLSVVDDSVAGTSSVLNSWGLRITPAKPVTG